MNETNEYRDGVEVTPQSMNKGLAALLIFSFLLLVAAGLVGVFAYLGGGPLVVNLTSNEYVIHTAWSGETIYTDEVGDHYVWFREPTIYKKEMIVQDALHISVICNDRLKDRQIWTDTGVRLPESRIDRLLFHNFCGADPSIVNSITRTTVGLACDIAAMEVTGDISRDIAERDKFYGIVHDQIRDWSLSKYGLEMTYFNISRIEPTFAERNAIAEQDVAAQYILREKALQALAEEEVKTAIAQTEVEIVKLRAEAEFQYERAKIAQELREKIAKLSPEALAGYNAEVEVEAVEAERKKIIEKMNDEISKLPRFVPYTFGIPENQKTTSTGKDDTK
jgi:hypothetical protein